MVTSSNETESEEPMCILHEDSIAVVMPSQADVWFDLRKMVDEYASDECIEQRDAAELVKNLREYADIVEKAHGLKNSVE